jgi:hypothetical protein
MKESAYFKQGVNDYLRGLTTCPYSMNSLRGEEWSMGWHSAQELDDEAYPPIQHDELDDEILNDLGVNQQIAQDNIEGD